MLTRRCFFISIGAAFAADAGSNGERATPANLDHVILGADDLRRGITWLEERTGVRAAFGGVHPGRGTRNALIALGPRCYLEILAPDPAQSVLAWYHELATLHDPRFIAWAVHTNDLATLAKQATAGGFGIKGPTEGSRTRPDGKVLRWRSFNLQGNREGLLPFFIEWNPASVHPSADAPSGCRLTSFHLQSPAAPELASACRALGVDVLVEAGTAPLIYARISSAKGEVRIPR